MTAKIFPKRFSKVLADLTQPEFPSNEFYQELDEKCSEICKHTANFDSSAFVRDEKVLNNDCNRFVTSNTESSVR